MIEVVRYYRVACYLVGIFGAFGLAVYLFGIRQMLASLFGAYSVAWSFNAGLLLSLLVAALLGVNQPIWQEATITIDATLIAIMPISVLIYFWGVNRNGSRIS